MRTALSLEIWDLLLPSSFPTLQCRHQSQESAVTSHALACICVCTPGYLTSDHLPILARESAVAHLVRWVAAGMNTMQVEIFGGGFSTFDLHSSRRMGGLSTAAMEPRPKAQKARHPVNANQASHFTISTCRAVLLSCKRQVLSQHFDDTSHHHLSYLNAGAAPESSSRSVPSR